MHINVRRVEKGEGGGRGKRSLSASLRCSPVAALTELVYRRSRRAGVACLDRLMIVAHHGEHYGHGVVEAFGAAVGEGGVGARDYLSRVEAPAAQAHRRPQPSQGVFLLPKFIASARAWSNRGGALISTRDRSRTKV